MLTAELDVDPFTVLGVSWRDTADLTDTVIRYRVRQADVWSDWEAVGESDIAPDTGSRDDRGSRRGATDAIVALDADGLQIWAEAATGTVSGLKAVLIDPGTDPAGTAATTQGSSTAGDAVIRDAAVLPAAPAAGPAIVTRAAWGADESLRTCNADLAPTTLAAAVHHTASTNAYNPEDVPGLLRGFLAYHTRPEAAGGRGWCDIGYNFLVDKFGRVFEGRAGSITKAVVGVHTGGFNSRTIGVAAIGDYSAAAPPGALLESLSQVIAWKFKTFRILGGSTVDHGLRRWRVQVPRGHGRHLPHRLLAPGRPAHRVPRSEPVRPDAVPAVAGGRPRERRGVRVPDLVPRQLRVELTGHLRRRLGPRPGEHSVARAHGDRRRRAHPGRRGDQPAGPRRPVPRERHPARVQLLDTGLGGHARGVHHRRQRRGRATT